MASRKQKNRSRSRTRQRQGGLQAQTLVEKARAALRNQDGRSALNWLRKAQHKGEAGDELAFLFFCACMSRARQLASDGMAIEAESMRARAEHYRGTFDYDLIGPADLTAYVGCLDIVDGFARYADYLKNNGPVGAVGRLLADRVVLERNWNALDALAPDDPFRRDAGIVRQSLDAMDSGNWAQAGAALQGIPRQSPFAPWRLFCKAMVHFGDGDDDSLRRAVALIPEDFVLARTVATWKHHCQIAGAQAWSAVQNALGIRDVISDSLVQDVQDAFADRKSIDDTVRIVQTFADAIYPEDRYRARRAIVNITTYATVGPGGRLSESKFAKVMARLIPRQKRRVTVHQALTLGQRFKSSDWNPYGCLEYLRVLSEDFPDPADQAIARARILETMARSKCSDLNLIYYGFSDEINALNAALDLRISHHYDIPTELMKKSLEEDPDNRDGYTFLCQYLRSNIFLRSDTQYRNVLKQIVDRFPEETETWIELATVQYQRNAYRQAETSLLQAQKHAPHNEKILDFRAIGFLKSSEQSRKRGRFDLAAKDLEKAEAMDRGVIEIPLLVKRVFLEIVSTDRKTDAILDRHLAPLPADEQLRTLILMIVDLSTCKDQRMLQDKSSQALQSALHKRESLLEELDESELLDLLRPIHEDFRILYRWRNAAWAVEPFWPYILSKIETRHVFKAFDLVIADEGKHAVRIEIERRLREVGDASNTMLLFYLAVIRHDEGQVDGAEHFRDILDKAADAEFGALREAAQRLAPYQLSPDLQRALQQFNFDILDPPDSPPDRRKRPSRKEKAPSKKDRKPVETPKMPDLFDIFDNTTG